MESQDNKIKQLLKGTVHETPDSVKNRIDETLLSLPEKKSIKSKMKYPVLAASVACALLIGTSAVSPKFSSAMKNLPIVGSVFELVGDLGLRNSSEQGLTQQVNVTAIDQGIAITITEVLFDGAEISVGYVLDHETQLHLGRMDLNANRKSLYSGGSERGDQVNEGHYAAVRKFPVREELPDQFNLSIDIKSLTGIVDSEWKEIQGNWEFKIPVTKLTRDVETFEFSGNNEVETGEQTFIVKKASFTPAVTVIYFDLIQPLDETHQPDSEILVQEDFQVIDDRGMVLENLGLNMSGNFNMKKNIVTYEGQIQLAPTNRIPKSITIRPIVETHKVDRTNGNVVSGGVNEVAPISTASLSNELPIRMNQGSAGDIIINHVEFLDDMINIYYEVEGTNPYRQASSLVIVDGNGKRYDREPYDLIRTEIDKYAFSASFQIPQQNQHTLSLHTFEVKKPNFVEDLQITLPIKK